MSPANCGISQDCTSAQNPSFESHLCDETPSTRRLRDGVALDEGASRTPRPHVTVVESLILNSVMAADVIAPPGER